MSFTIFKSRRQERNYNINLVVENFFEHFKNLDVSKDNECIHSSNTECDMNAVINELDVPISVKEVVDYCCN